MTATADWLVSSRAWQTQAITVDGNPVNVTASLGGLYLIHNTAALDLLARVVVAMTAAGVVGAAAFVTEDRHVRLEAAGVFTVTWGLGTTLRDLLGFTGDLAAADGYTAPLRSPLLWSPGKVLTPELSPLDTHGQPVADISATIGRQGSLVVRQEGTPTVRQRWALAHVPLTRVWYTRPEPVAGEFASFWETELIAGQQWIVLRRVGEGLSSTASADYAGKVQLGPYFADMTDRNFRALPFTRSSGFERVEARYDFTIPAVKTAEWN